jgi:hypothetical protein
MAFTVSTIVKGVAYGNQMIRVLNVTADAAEGNVTTGLRNLSYVQVSPVSAPTMPNIRENADSTGTVSAGLLGMSNCTSGNIYRVVAYGS